MKQTPASIKSTISGSSMGLNLGQQGQCSNILDVIVPSQMNHSLPSGLAHVDCLFTGTGYMPGTVCMITGEPGNGKTTLSLQMADAATGQGHLVMFTGLEESLYQIKRTFTRLGLKHGFVPDVTHDVNDLLARANALQALPENKGKTMILVIDSLPCLEVKVGKKVKTLTGEKMAQTALAMLTAWAKQTWNVVLVLNHVTKGGKFVGKQTIKHMVDCHLHLAWDRNRKSETYNERIMEMSKNRFGSAGFFYPFKLTARGLVFEGQEGYGDIPD